MIHNYSVRKQDNLFIFVKDGYDVACPFQPSLVAQKGDEINISRITCSTHCALADLQEEEVYDVATNKTSPSDDLITKTFYVTRCGCCEKKHQVSLNINNLKSI
jgi:hypothetical protein